MDERKQHEGSHRRRRQPATTRAPKAQRVEPSAARRPQRPAARHIHWARHGIEFLVIVAGIMVSFLLNEWRQERQDRREEQRLLGDLLEDLRQDSLHLANEVDMLLMILDFSGRLERHAENRIPTDSIHSILGPSLAYSRIPLRQVTYRTMIGSGGTALVRDPELMRDLLLLYEQDYFMFAELSEIDKRTSMERMLPYVEKRIDIRSPDPKDFETMTADTEWKNHLYMSMYFKSTLVQYMRTLG
jgi:hypothetical protein